MFKIVSRMINMMFKPSSNHIQDSNGLYDEQNYHKWKSLNADSVQGMIAKSESDALLFLSTFQEKRGNIVEIGSWLGKSTIYLAKGCSLTGNGIVYAVDHFKGNLGKEKFYFGDKTSEETIIEDFKQNLKNAGVYGYVKPMVMSSEKATKIIDEDLRAVFIDGDHTYEGVLNDIELWQNKVLSGGYLIFHDYSNHFSGSMKAIDEFLNNSDSFKIVLLIDSLLVSKKN
jgi:MMP 1-O-methyltransferase